MHRNPINLSLIPGISLSSFPSIGTANAYNSSAVPTAFGGWTCRLNTSYECSFTFNTSVRPLNSVLFRSFSSSCAVHLSFSLSSAGAERSAKVLSVPTLFRKVSSTGATEVRPRPREIWSRNSNALSPKMPRRYCR